MSNVAREKSVHKPLEKKVKSGTCSTEKQMSSEKVDVKLHQGRRERVEV